jgi:hypothetical protein
MRSKRSCGFICGLSDRRSEKCVVFEAQWMAPTTGPSLHKHSAIRLTHKSTWTYSSPCWHPTQGWACHRLSSSAPVCLPVSAHISTGACAARAARLCIRARACLLSRECMCWPTNDTTTCTNLSSLKSGWAQRSSRTQIVLCSLLVYTFCIVFSETHVSAAAFTAAAVRAVYTRFDYHNDRMCLSYAHCSPVPLRALMLRMHADPCAWANLLTARVRHASSCIVRHAALASVDRC